MRRLLDMVLANGALSALVANLCLALIPFAGANLALTLQQKDVYGYPPTEAARRATRAEIEYAVLRLLPSGMDRRRGWEELVARELREGDPHAARGFVLTGRAVLGPMETTRINRALRGAASDVQIAAAAAPILSNETRDVFSETAGWMAQADAERDPAAFLVSGGRRDFATQAEAWLAGRDPDHLVLVLTGVRSARSGRLSQDIVLGASTLKDARRAGRLGPLVARQLEALAARAIPPERLRANLEAAAARTAGKPDGGLAMWGAFHDSSGPGFEDFVAQLSEIGQMAAATSSRGAARLLAQARDVSDLPRLRLVAQSGGDRAVAVAKRMTEGRPLTEAAHGTLHWTRDLISAVSAFAALLIAGLAALALTLAPSIRQWRLFGVQGARPPASL